MWLNFEFGQDLCKGNRIAFIKGDKRKKIGFRKDCIRYVNEEMRRVFLKK